MKMFRNLYTKAQEMSEEKVLDTNSIVLYTLYNVNENFNSDTIL